MTIGCAVRRYTRFDTIPVSGAQGYGSPPFFKEGSGVVLLAKPLNIKKKSGYYPKLNGECQTKHFKY